MHVKSSIVAALLVLFTPARAIAADPPPAALRVLQPTGEIRAGLPVMAPSPRAQEFGPVLVRGFSGRLLRLYALQQEFLRRRTGRTPEPAYLVLTRKQGGFPRVGLAVDGQPKPDAGWVDLHQSSTPSGRFGAVDQIFPHELLHIITRQLAGEPRESGANQVHAVGVRTDPVIAFQEGFAEHAQIMVIDDPDALPETMALARDTGATARAWREVSGYGRDLTARFVPVAPGQMRFLLWFSQAEQALRYAAVKANTFAREPLVPARLLAKDDKYDAYLYRAIVPANADGRLRSAAEMLSIEGVIAHVVWRWVTDPVIQAQLRDAAFYAMFGATADEVPPLENAYLKIFYALHAGKPSDLVGLLRAYVAAFPDEAARLDQIVTTGLGGQRLPNAPELWLANDALMTGTSVFDQYRGLPRPHTFDVNAASVFDWLTVPGVTPAVATRLADGAPYRSLSEVTGAHDVPTPVRERIVAMAEAMDALRREASDDGAASLSLSAIVKPYAWRALALLAGVSTVAAWFARRFGLRRWWTAALCGTVATVAVIVVAWVFVSAWWMPAAAPFVIGGGPAAAAIAVRRRSWRAGARVLRAWVAAIIPALVAARTWF